MDIILNLDTAFRIIVFSAKQIKVAGYDMIQWGGAYFALYLSVYIVKFIIANSAKIFGVIIPSGTVNTDEAFEGFYDMYAQGGEESRRQAAKDIYGE